MTKRMIISVTLLLVVLGVVFGYKPISMMIQYMGSGGFARPPVTVSAREAELQSWQPRIAAVGVLSAVRGVDLSNELPGMVASIEFESGQEVEKGKLLVQLDDSTEQARLPGLEARVKLARANYERTRQLIERKLTAAENLDSVESELSQAEAELAELKATIAKKAIRAPFAGTLGIRLVNEGQYLPAGTPIVTLQSLDELYADFSLPEQYLDRVSAGQPVRVEVSTWPEQAFGGWVNAVSVKVDPESHNFDIQAIIDNPEHRLRPGMFADVEVQAGAPREVVTVPKTAVSYSLYGDAVYVVSQDGTDEQGNPVLKANQRFVQVGEANGERVAISEGLQPGERVVTAGQLKLNDGARVKINNEVALADDAEDSSAAASSQF